MAYFPPRKRLLRSLKHVGGRLCGYARKGELPSICDCKFDVEKLRRSEHTGCAEIRLMVSLLENMTDKEYNERMSRRDA